jgi:ParB/RepB/Spo0J family partition protein
MKFHPVAEIFPMMSDEELDDLAQDIKANGLINPIVVDEGQSVDGRNRLEACRRAGVEPVFETLNGTDPIAFILSSNDKRRHMSKGQRVMIAAQVRMLFNNTQEKAAKQAGTSREYMAKANVVLEFAP